MDVEGIDGDGGVALQEPVEVDVRDDVARGATFGELKYALEVASDRDGRLRQAMKGRGGVVRRRDAVGGIVALRDSLEEGREDGHDSRDRVGILHQLRHWWILMEENRWRRKGGGLRLILSKRFILKS